MPGFDGDQFIVDPKRTLESFVPQHSKNVSLIIADNPNIINNGAFIMRNTPWLRQTLLPLWRDLDFQSNSSGYLFTDNGSMLEMILRLFVPGYEADACGAPTSGGFNNMLSGEEWKFCVNRKLYHFLGEICMMPKDCTNHTGRAGNGLVLLHGKKAFNHHGCPSNGQYRFRNCKDDEMYWKRTIKYRAGGFGAETYFLDGQPGGARFLEFMVS